MNYTDYEAKESLLYIVHDNIAKICEDRYLITDADNNGVVIDVSSNEILKGDKDSLIGTLGNHIIRVTTIKPKGNSIYKYVIEEGKELLEVLNPKSLKVRYSIKLRDKYIDNSSINSAINNLGITVKELGKFTVISFDRTSVIIDSNDEIVIDRDIIDCTYNKVWFSNGFHLKGRFNTNLLNEKYNFTDSNSVEILTNYDGTEIISVYKQDIKKGLCKSINVRAKASSDYDGYSYIGYKKYLDNINIDVGIIVCDGSIKYNGYTDIYGCVTARDIVIAERSLKGEIYRGALSKVTGNEIISLRQNLKTIKQINSDTYALIYDEKTSDGIEVVSIKYGTIIPKGILSNILTLTNLLPIAVFTSSIYAGYYIIGNDYKLHYLEPKNIEKYTVHDVNNAYEIQKIDNGNYKINILGEVYTVNEHLDLLLELNLDYKTS